MPKEIELAVSDINEAEVRKQLKQLGAKFKTLHEYKRVNFQVYTKGKSEDNDYYTSWIRVRTDGKRTTLAFKEQWGISIIAKRNECEVEVSNFLDTVRILRKSMPDSSYSYVENGKEEYELDGVTIDISKWPFAPAFLEFEGESKEKIMAVFKKLNIRGEIAKTPAYTEEEFYRKQGLDSKKIMLEMREKLDKMLQEARE